MSMMWIGIGSGVAGLAGAGASIYGASQAGNVANAGRRNLGDMLAGSLSGVQNYGGLYSASGNQNLANSLFGSIDTEAFLEQHPEFKEGFENNGRDPNWLTRAISNAGYIDPSSLPRGGGMADTTNLLQSIQDRANARSSSYQRDQNFADIQRLAPGAAALTRQLNPEYYSALGALTSASGKPIDASPYETKFGAMALSGSPTFALGGTQPGGSAGMGGRMFAPGGGKYGNRMATTNGGGLVGAPSRSLAVDKFGSPMAETSAVSDQGVDMVGAPSSSQAVDKFGNPMAETSRMVSDQGVDMVGGTMPPGDLGDDMRFPGGAPTDPNQMSLGRVDERVGGPGALTRSLTRGALDTSTGPAALENTLYGQAQDALALGGNLTAQEERDARAGAAAGASARGLGDTNSALAAEVLNLDSAKRARLDANRNFAAGVDTLMRNGQASDRSYGLSLDNADLARRTLRGNLQQQNITNTLDAARFNASQRAADLAALGGANQMYMDRNNAGFNRLATAAQLATANYFDPSSVLGSVDNRLNSMGTMGMVPDYTGQILSYGNDIDSSNANARAAGAINSANAWGALGGGLLSAAGSLGSAYIRGRTGGGTK